MPLNLEDKKAIVAEVSEVAASALSAVAADYRGLTVMEMNDLRAKARNAGVYLRVVRNTLARRAVENTEFSCIQDALVGPLVIAFSQEEPGAAARLFRDFAKGKDHFNVKIVSIGGKLMDASSLDAVASLPSRDEAIALLMAVMKAPVGKFVRTTQETYAKLVRTVGAIRDKKQAAE